MSESSKDGDYCMVCGGISPGKVTTRRITINGKEVGIDKLDRIMAEVRALHLSDDAAITDELLKRASKFNYVPTSKTRDYGEALLKEYKRGA